MKIRSILTTLPLALAAALPVAAQDVQYETATRLELPGAAGTMMRVAARLGGGSLDVLEKTSIKGSMMRTDTEESSIITDLENRRMITIDHKAKTYSVFTFDEMIGRAQAAADELKAAAVNDSRAERGNAGAEAEFDFRFAVEDGRKRDKVAGYDANRFFLTMEAEGQYVPEGETEKQDAGTLVLLTDMWASTNVPVLAARQAFDQATAQEYATAASAMMDGLAAAFADDPRMKVAFERSAQEALKIEGIPVRTVTSFVAVAPGKKFDRALVTEPKDRASGVAAAAARGVMGGITGRLGRRQQEEQEPEEPTQSVIMTITSEIRNVKTASLDASLFGPPAGYREIKPEG